MARGGNKKAKKKKKEKKKKSPRPCAKNRGLDPASGQLEAYHHSLGRGLPFEPNGRGKNDKERRERGTKGRPKGKIPWPSCTDRHRTHWAPL